MTFEIHYHVYGCFRRPDADIELAKDAIDAGFEGVWIADHFHPWIDSRPYTHHALPWLGALMEAVPDVPVGVSVMCPTIRYRPALLAQAFATLDNMYPDRLNLGLGVGEAINESPFIDGEWPDWGDRAEMLIEAIEVMTTLWESPEYVIHNGTYYQYNDIKLYTRPVGNIDLHWAGWGKNSSRCAGKYTGNIITIASPDQIRDKIVPQFKAGLEERGQDLDTADITTEFMANIGDPNQLVPEVQERGEYIPYEAELDNPDPRAVQDIADERLAEMSEDEIVEMYNITPNPNEIIKKLEELKESGVTRVLVGSNCGDPRATIDAFERVVLPYFN